MKTCKYCGGEIMDTAKKCKHCGEWLDINCPYCDGEVSTQADKCPHCGEKLTPKNGTTIDNIQEDLTNISKELNNITTGKFILFSILSLGIYTMFQMVKLIERLKIVGLSKKYKIELWFCLVFIILMYITIISNPDATGSAGIFFIAYTYLVIGSIKKYVLEKYNKKLKLNHLGALFFSVFYLHFFINTLDRRIK